MVQNVLSKGRKVRFDIGSSNFEKRKKKVTNIRLRKLSGNFKKLALEKISTEGIETTPPQSKKTIQVRIRPSLASIDLTGLKSQIRRNNSLDSPTKKNLNLFGRYN